MHFFKKLFLNGNVCVMFYLCSLCLVSYFNSFCISHCVCFSSQVLVDLNTKNERGLYQSRIKATVGGRPLTFYSLVGLENEAFYRSMPRIIAVAIDALKT